MLTVGLLERLEGVVPHGRSQGDAAIIDSVFKNLNLVLNSRRDSCETRPDFGLADFNPAEDIRRSAELIARDVAAQIRAFEPRLHNVQVRHAPEHETPAQLAFEVRAELAGPQRAAPVSFRSVLTSDGHIRLAR